MKPLILTLSYLLIILFAIIPASSCKNEEIYPSRGFEEVTLKNFNGLDGCGFVFEKRDGKYLEPTNLGSFIVTYTDGKKYFLKYKKIISGSICQVGEMIEVIDLNEGSL